MGGTQIETEESGWTKANLQKLLAAMKTSIPKRHIMSAYYNGLKSVDWNKVAFSPFSPEECQEKWGEILHKMRKTRTLTELIVEAEDVISSPVNNTKIHPELPKRPSPANAIFYEENWAKFKEKHPNMSRRKIFRRLIMKYKELPDEKKAPYVEKFELATKEYNRRMLEFRKKYSETPNGRSSKKRKRLPEDLSDDEELSVANDLPPKPPRSGYNLFCMEQRASMTGFSGNSYVTVWAQRWRDLTESQRVAYNTRCSELRSQYTQKLNQCLMTLDKEKQRQILDESGIKRPPRDKKLRKELPGEPRMPSRSGNVIFCKNQMELLKDKIPKSTERFTKINQKWRNLSDKEKEYYKAQADENLQNYCVELQKWFTTLSAAEQTAYWKRNPNKSQFLKFNIEDDGKEPLGGRYRPSDSEDEDIEDSSSDEEQEGRLDFYEVEDDAESDIIAFKVF